MGGDVSTALSLLTVGMITVFSVLLLVVLTGNLLIQLSNRIGTNSENGDISPSKVAAIVGAVEILTEGRGRITKIEKD